MTSQQTVDRLTLEIEELQQALTTASRMAANDDVAGSGDPLAAARQLIETRELLKLKRIALSQAKRLAGEEARRQDRVEREKVRDEICALTDSIESEAKKMIGTIRKLGKHFQALTELEKAIKQHSANAADWPHEAFSYTKPGDAVYKFLIHALAAEIPLSNFPLNAWPSEHKSALLSDPAEAFRNYLYWREEWLCRNANDTEETIHVS